MGNYFRFGAAFFATFLTAFFTAFFATFLTAFFATFLTAFFATFFIAIVFCNIFLIYRDNGQGVERFLASEQYTMSYVKSCTHMQHNCVDKNTIVLV